MVVSKVRGRFDKFEGTIVTAEDPAESQVSVTIDAASIDTHNEQRDDHVRAPDFLDVEQFPVISFTSTAVRQSGSDLELDGELRIRDVTAPVTLEFEANGFIADPYGSVRASGRAGTSSTPKLLCRGAIDAPGALGTMIGVPRTTGGPAS